MTVKALKGTCAPGVRPSQAALRDFGLGAAGALSSGYSHPADCKVLKEVEKGPWVQFSHHLQSGARGCTGSHGGRPKSFELGLGFLDILPGVWRGQVVGRCVGFGT